MAIRAQCSVNIKPDRIRTIHRFRMGYCFLLALLAHVFLIPLAIFLIPHQASSNKVPSRENDPILVLPVSSPPTKATDADENPPSKQDPNPATKIASKSGSPQPGIRRGNSKIITDEPPTEDFPLLPAETNEAEAGAGLPNLMAVAGPSGPGSPTDKARVFRKSVNIPPPEKHPYHIPPESSQRPIEDASKEMDEWRQHHQKNVQPCPNGFNFDVNDLWASHYRRERRNFWPADEEPPSTWDDPPTKLPPPTKRRRLRNP